MWCPEEDWERLAPCEMVFLKISQLKLRTKPLRLTLYLRLYPAALLVAMSSCLALCPVLLFLLARYLKKGGHAPNEITTAIYCQR